MAIEKRRYPRVEISWPVNIISSDHLVSGKTENLSRVGTLIRCSELPELAHPFQLIFKPSGDRIVLANAKRVWSKTFTEDDRRSHTMGVRFTFILDHDFQLINEVISNRVSRQQP